MHAQTTIEILSYSSGVLTTCAMLFLASAALAWRMRYDP
jgi:hypothetical protein